MKHILVLVFLFISLIANAQGWRKGEMEVKAYLNSQDDVQYILKKGWSFDQPASVPGFCRIYLTPEELSGFNESNISYEVTVNDLNAYYKDFWTAMVPSGYYTYQQIITIADSLQTAFPGICKKIIIGQSLGNRQLAVLKISDNVNLDEAEPEIFFEAGIHGDEVGGPENLIRYAREICKGYGVNSEYTTIINQTEIFLLLMVNPDGRENMSRYNNNGVDLNRDCGYMWNAEGNSSGPFSQHESKMVRDFVFSNQFTSFTDYHSGIEIISCPWSYRPQSPPDMQHILSLASIYSSNSGYSGGLTYGQGYSLMYPINGSTKDYSYGSTGCISWSMEISNEKQPPSSQIYSYYSKNRPAMTATIKNVSYGIRGTIKDSITGKSIAARIIVNTGLPTYSDPEVGDYFKYLVQGTYTVKISANGYQTKVLSGVNVPAQGFTVNDILLSPQNEYYAHKVVSSHISGNNHYDEGATWAALGAPDNVRYSLGKGGNIVLDMGDTIRNIQGYDFKVFEEDSNPEGYAVYLSVSMDGPWTFIGTGTGTMSFDMQGTGIQKARYLKIVDDGDGSAVVADAGFDLDGVQNLYSLPLVNFSSNNLMPCTGEGVNFTDESTGNIIAWKWIFPGGFPASSTAQNPSGIVYSSPGIYDVSLRVFDGFSYQTLNRTAYISAFTSPATPPQPSGASQICQAKSTSLQIIAPDNWQSINWNVIPPEAGTFSGLTPNTSFTAASAFTGSAAISAQVQTSCGISGFSPTLILVVLPGPEIYLGADTVLGLSQSVLLNAEYPSATYLWNTGATTPEILVDYALAGLGTSSFSVTTTAPNQCSDSDTILITFDQGIGEKKLFNSQHLKVYPNPASNQLFVDFMDESSCNIDLYDNTGRLVHSFIKEYGHKTFSFSVSNLDNGFYFLKIRSKEYSAISRFTIFR